jgi:hypothetical protein
MFLNNQKVIQGYWLMENVSCGVLRVVGALARLFLCVGHMLSLVDNTQLHVGD